MLPEQLSLWQCPDWQTLWILQKVFLHGFYSSTWIRSDYLRNMEKWTGTDYWGLTRIRYCDDFVWCFQNRYEAEIFKQRLEERFVKYRLELAEEKMKILEFGSFASRTEKQEDKGKPRYLWLSWSHVLLRNRWKEGIFYCRVKTSKKKFRSKIKAMKEWIKRNRMMPLEVIFDTVNAKLRGYYQ